MFLISPPPLLFFLLSSLSSLSFPFLSFIPLRDDAMVVAVLQKGRKGGRERGKEMGDRDKTPRPVPSRLGIVRIGTVGLLVAPSAAG